MSKKEEIVQCFNEALNLYLSGKKRESFEKTKENFKELEILTLKDWFDKDWNKRKEVFEERIDSSVKDLIYKEYSLACGRAIYGTRFDFGYTHNIYFWDFFLKVIKIKPEEILRKEEEEYFRSNQIFFSRDNLDKYKGKGRIEFFYRNASFADLYAHKGSKGFCDLYTPLILSRMAVEQYVEQLCEDNKIDKKVVKENYLKKHQEELRGKPGISNYVATLSDLNYISNGWSQEIYAVIFRGNMNTHKGWASYPFAVIHSLEVLKECFKYFEAK